MWVFEVGLAITLCVCEGPSGGGGGVYLGLKFLYLRVRNALLIQPYSFLQLHCQL